MVFKKTKNKLMDAYKNACSNATWQDYTIIVLILFFTTYYLLFFATFTQLPSEYYGGDHYAHLSSVVKIYDTSNPFISSHYEGELQHYPWLNQFAIALFAKLTMLSPYQAATLFPALVMFFTIIITYFFGLRFFRNKTFALILTAAWAVHLVPSMHPSEVTKQLFIPLIALWILLLYEVMAETTESEEQEETKESKKSKERENTTKAKKIIVGIMYGLSGLQHVVTFFMSSIILIIVLFLSLLEGKSTSIIKKVKVLTKKSFPIILIGWCIAALFWAPLLIRYHGETVNDWQVYAAEDLFPSTEFVSGSIASIINLGNTTTTVILSILALIVVLYFTIKKADKRIFTPLLLFCATLIGIIHPYITLPLLDLTFGYYRFPVVFEFIRHIIPVLALYYLWGWISSYSKDDKKRNRIKVLGAILFIAFTFWTVIQFTDLVADYKESERYQYATENEEKIDAYLALREFIEENNIIGDDEVVLSFHPDMGFLFNAMTGRNVVTSRVTHASPFVNHNERVADVAVIFYGDNETKAYELLEEYKVTYIFSEMGNIQFQFTCLDNWDEIKSSNKKDKTVLAYWCLLTDPSYESYLEEYGITTQDAAVRLAAGDKDVPLTDVIAILPMKVLIEYDEVFAYEGSDGETILKLYKVVWV
jgi:putative Ca2+/H+ antiporter (TMEM165/GDT1 family)